MKNLAMYDNQIIMVTIDNEVRLGWANLIKDELSGKNKLFFFEDRHYYQEIDSHQIKKVLGSPENYLNDQNKSSWLTKIEFFATVHEINLTMAMSLKMVEMASGNFLPSLDPLSIETIKKITKDLTPNTLTDPILEELYQLAEQAQNDVTKRYICREHLAEEVFHT